MLYLRHCIKRSERKPRRKDMHRKKRTGSGIKGRGGKYENKRKNGFRHWNY